MGVLQDLVDSADDRSAAKQSQIDNIQDQIDEKQAEQDAYKAAMIEIESEVNAYLLSQGDWLFTYDDYFNGTLRSIDDNLTDWILYEILSSSIEMVTDTRFRAIIDTNNIDKFDIGDTLYFKSTSPTIPLPYGTILDSTSDVIIDTTSSIVYIKIHMLEGSIPANLDSIVLPVSVGSPTYLTDRYTEFDFYNDYVHNPVGLTGTYGTKDMIAILSDAKSMLLIDKSKIDTSKTIFPNRA